MGTQKESEQCHNENENENLRMDFNSVNLIVATLSPFVPAPTFTRLSSTCYGHVLPFRARDVPPRL